MKKDVATERVADLREMRRAAGVTQTELALRCGYTDSRSIKDIEQGLRSPKLSVMESMAAALEVSLGRIIEACQETSRRAGTRARKGRAA